MKKYSFIAVVLTAVCLLTACNKKDEERDMWNSLWRYSTQTEARLTHLEEMCNELNSNVSALQTIVNALSNNITVTNVAPVLKNGEEIGYTITFSDGKIITIYHGQDGKDGSTPEVSVHINEDGSYEWIVNGETIKDANGNPIVVAGADGKDGITPRFKIENDYWYVSYDNGSTWTQLGKATGEKGETGAQGPAGVDGESIFLSVTHDENFVYFTLTDGTTFPITKHNGGNMHNQEDIIEFKDVNVKMALIDLNIDTNEDGEISYAEAAAVNTALNFIGNASIISFNELQYFTNITSTSFENCKKLSEIILPNHLTQIPNSAFLGTEIRSITIPNECISIGNNAFSSSKLRTIKFNQKCTTIGSYAGITSNKDTLTLPNSILSLGHGALSSGNYTTLILPDSLIDGATSVAYNNRDRLTSIVWNCINYTSALSGDNQFGLAGLRDYYNTTYNPTYNTKITNVEFGNNVRFIPANLCYNMSGLRVIDIPASVINIGDQAFYGTNIRTVYSRNPTPPMLGANVFPTGVTTIYVPINAVNSYMEAWSTYARKIVGYNFD